MSIAPILYVEDDENDAVLMQRAFRKAEVEVPLQILDDGQKALDYLSAKGAYGDRKQFPMPQLVLLDLKLPRKTGLEVLKWIRAAPPLSTLPVVMLTSSNQEGDMHRAYLLGANGYLVKPGGPQQLLSLVQSIKSFWLQHNLALNADARFPWPKGVRRASA